MFALDQVISGVSLHIFAPVFSVSASIAVEYFMSLQTVKLQAHSCFTVLWHMLRDRMTTPVPSSHGCQFGLFDRSFAAFELLYFVLLIYCTFPTLPSAYYAVLSVMLLFIYSHILIAVMIK